MRRTILIIASTAMAESVLRMAYAQRIDVVVVEGETVKDKHVKPEAFQKEMQFKLQKSNLEPLPTQREVFEQRGVIPPNYKAKHQRRQ